jgi:hypothetical protein
MQRVTPWLMVLFIIAVCSPVQVSAHGIIAGGARVLDVQAGRLSPGYRSDGAYRCTGATSPRYMRRNVIQWVRATFTDSDLPPRFACER